MPMPMPLHPDLLSAISSKNGGKVALVLGAGCSVEHPTNIPVSRVVSERIHERLILDGVLQPEDCKDKSDLSCVSDAVFKKFNSQRHVVDRLRDEYPLKLAPANKGYLIAAAMLCEGAITFIVTLNYDLALTHALSELRADTVGVVDCPEDLNNQKAINVYYLHRNANEKNPELWVLRTEALAKEWKDHWEELIALKVLTTPVVVFAGLGTPVGVLIHSTDRIRKALPVATKLFLADPGNMEDSKLFMHLGLGAAQYINQGWRQLMEGLSLRLLEVHMSSISAAAQLKAKEDNLPGEAALPELLSVIKDMGLVGAGKLRAQWLLHNAPYLAIEESFFGLMADLLLAIATICRVSGAMATILEDGRVDFRREGRVVTTAIVVSGRGYRSKNAIEADLENVRTKYRPAPTVAIVGGTSDFWNNDPTPPEDIVAGSKKGDILRSPLPKLHVSELRTSDEAIKRIVP